MPDTATRYQAFNAARHALDRAELEARAAGRDHGQGSEEETRALDAVASAALQVAVEAKRLAGQEGYVRNEWMELLDRTAVATEAMDLAVQALTPELEATPGGALVRAAHLVIDRALEGL